MANKDKVSRLPYEVLSLIYGNLPPEDLVAAIPNVSRLHRSAAALAIDDAVSENPHNVRAMWTAAGSALPADGLGYYNWLAETLPPVTSNPKIFDLLVANHNLLGYTWARRQWDHPSGASSVDITPYLRDQAITRDMLQTTDTSFIRWLMYDDVYPLLRHKTLGFINDVISFLTLCCTHNAFAILKWALQHLTDGQKTAVRREFTLSKFGTCTKDCRAALDVYQSALQMTDSELHTSEHRKHNGANPYVWTWLRAKNASFTPTPGAISDLEEPLMNDWRTWRTFPLDVVDAILWILPNTIYMYAVLHVSPEALVMMCTTEPHVSHILDNEESVLFATMARKLSIDQLQRCLDAIFKKRPIYEKSRRLCELFEIYDSRVPLDTARWLVDNFPFRKEPKFVLDTWMFQENVLKSVECIAKIDLVLDYYTLTDKIDATFAVSNVGLTELKHLIGLGIVATITPDIIAAYPAVLMANASFRPASFVYDRCVWLTEEHGIKLDRKALADLAVRYYTKSDTFEVALKFIARFNLREEVVDQVQWKQPDDRHMYAPALTRLASRRR